MPFWMVGSEQCNQLAHKSKIAGEAFEDKQTTQSEWATEKEFASHEIELNKSKVS